MSCKEGDQASDPSVSKSKLPQNTENASNENVDYDDDDDDTSGEGTYDDASSPVSDEGPLSQSKALEEESSLDNDRNGSSLDQVKSLEDVSHDTLVNGDKGFNTTETCNNVLGQEIQPVKETMDVNGFEVFSSQVEFVRRIFERHPDIAAEFRAKNQHLRNACLSFLLSLIETLCQSLEELSNEDLVEADVALAYLKDAGFKVDWLEEKLDQLKENKEKERSGLARLQEIEENLLKLKLKCSEIDALASELSVTRTALSFDDLV